MIVSDVGQASWPVLFVLQMRRELLRTASATLATRGCCSIPQVVGQFDPLPFLTWRLPRIAPENRADLWFSLGQAVSADPGRAMVPVFHRRGSLFVLQMRRELLRTASATLATRGCCSIPQVVGQHP